jgi:hypothetical protein
MLHTRYTNGSPALLRGSCATTPQQSCSIPKECDCRNEVEGGLVSSCIQAAHQGMRIDTHRELHQVGTGPLPSYHRQMCDAITEYDVLLSPRTVRRGDTKA